MGNEKKLTRKQQAQQTREKTLAVCRELLAKHSFDELSIQSICKSAEISVGAFYHHFSSKSDVIVELYKDVDSDFSEHILPSLLQEEPIQGIIQYLSAQCEYAYRAGHDTTKNVYKAQIDNGNEFFLSLERGLPYGLYTLIKRAQESQVLQSSVNCEELTKDLLLISRGAIYHWCVTQGRTDILCNVKRLISNYLKPFLTSKT